MGWSHQSVVPVDLLLNNQTGSHYQEYLSSVEEFGYFYVDVELGVDYSFLSPLQCQGSLPNLA